MPFKSEREYRAMKLLVPAVQKRIESDYYVEGYATTFDVPYLMFEYEGVKYYEVIDRNALAEADMTDVIMQFDHQGRVFARLSNKTLGIEPDNHGLFTYADLSRTGAAKEMYQDITSGMITKMSWAFSVRESSYDKETHMRKILKVKKVYDVSAVSYPANNDTEISARSWVDGVIESERQELSGRQLELAKRKYFYFNGGKIQ